MQRHVLIIGGVAIAALFWGSNLHAQTGCKATGGGGKNCPPSQMRSTTQAQRKAARARQAPQKRGVARVYAGVSKSTMAYSTLANGVSIMANMAAPLSTPDVFGIPNWANSPLPTMDPLTGAISGGIRKFVNTLPGFCGISPWGTAGTNELGQCLPVASPDTATFPGSDFYRIGLKDFFPRMHADLPLTGTKIRGYVDLTNTQPQQYLGPFILATRNRPVRVLFQNQLTANGKSFIPVDTSYMGAGTVNDGTRTELASQQRAVIHLHGGVTPWISDGTPHQWVTPPNETVTNATGFAKGWTFRNVPDMPATLGMTPTLTDGLATLFWTNQQSGRLMFYHDHSYGTTRLNVYAGEAAGYLLVDPAQETALRTATAPGTIVTDPTTGSIIAAQTDLAHVIPLVIQDKTFVPDNGEVGGQLAATDPTWDIANFGGKGSLWFPHVYMPNQNPYDNSGANPFGRWDYGPWFWPPQNPGSLISPPVACTSVAYPGQSLTCPGTPNPSGTPEGFMDTAVINGTAYPKLTVDPAAYRFQILNAGNDRAMNLGLYVADPLTVAVTNGGSGYTAPPTVSFAGGVGPADATATASISTGSVISVAVATGGSLYTAAPTVAFTGGGGSGAAAIATLTNDVVTGIVVTNGGSGYTSAPTPTLTNAPTDTTGSGATASATITPAGTVFSVTVTNPGSTPWTAAPTVAFTNAATDTTGTGASAIASVNTELKMVAAVPHTSGSLLPLCGMATMTGGGGLAMAAVNNGIPLNKTGLPAGCWPTTWPSDGRDGGVPDPATAGPPIVQIGSEGGLLPAAAVIPSTPMGYEYNRRSITVLNVFSHGLLLGPAERADVIVDFSAFAGKTLILYNDGPAPVPAFDPRSDYYTGDPDQTTTGGAPSTLPGYGPNTRTLMQIQVSASGSSNNFNLGTLQAAMPTIFASTQDAMIVPETAYGNGPDTYVRISDTSLAGFLGGPIGGLTLTGGGSGYTAPVTVSITGGGGAGATATATLAASIATLTLTNGGSNYSAPPAVAFNGGNGSGATATATLAATSVASLTLTAQGSGYTSAPTVTISAPACTPGPGCVTATATATVQNSGQRRVTSLTLTNPGAGYTTTPTVTISGGGGTGATATAALSRRAVASVTLTSGGTGFTSVPTVSFSGGGGTGAAATAALAPAAVAGLTLTSAGTGYTSAPIVTITGATGSGAGAIAVAPVNPILPKTIQELFTLDYGRMNAILGVEIPFTNFLTQTTIPYGFVDPPTEIFKDGETQLWKITHNGVDTHFIHFHLFTVQVVNRVGWDGAIKPPDQNEMGYKDTVRMNPLEDIIVAVRPIKPALPWDLPNSVRPLDVTEPVGYTSTMSFTNVDPTNQPAAVVNDMTNFGWEYVWHCHILGHEENDMMRAMSLVLMPPPVANIGVATARNGSRDTVTLTWADNSIIETGYTVQRSTSLNGPWTTLGTVASTTGPTTGTVMTYSNTNLPRGASYVYRVITNNVVGYTRAFAAPAAGYPYMSGDSLPAITGVVVTP